MQEDDPRNRKNLRDDDDLARPVQLEPMALPTADHMVPSLSMRSCLVHKYVGGLHLLMWDGDRRVRIRADSLPLNSVCARRGLVIVVGL